MLISVFCFSCGSSSDGDSVKVKEDRIVDVKKETAYGKLVYLDTAENIYNILCQDWVLEDDAEGLEGMTEGSKFEIPYRSFYFSTKGSFVKNPRNTFDYGNWDYDDAAKTISITNSIDKTRDQYKIAKVGAEELVLVNTGVGSSSQLKFIGSGKRFENAADEPYFLENNRWRIKPKQRETDSAIHQRLKENIKFFLLFY